MTAWTTPATYAADYVIGVTDWHTQIRDNLNHLSEQISRTGWTSFTPSWTNITVGAGGTNVGKYGLAGKTTFFEAEFTYGTGSAVSGDVLLNYPAASVTYSGNHQVAVATFLDASGPTVLLGVGLWATTAACAVRAFSVSGSYIGQVVLSSTVPFTWATGDKIMVHGFYESA